jgi:hypothetical protein
MAVPKAARVLFALVLMISAPAALKAVCTSNPTPSSVDLPYTGGSGTFTAPFTLCQESTPWAPIPSDPWITATGGGIGTASVDYTVAPNLTPFPRDGRIDGLPAGVAPFFITQAAAPIAVIPTVSSLGLALLAGALALLGVRRLAG